MAYSARELAAVLAVLAPVLSSRRVPYLNWAASRVKA
jgi:hypothetical protein